TGCTTCARSSSCRTSESSASRSRPGTSTRRSRTGSVWRGSNAGPRAPAFLGAVPKPPREPAGRGRRAGGGAARYLPRVEPRGGARVIPRPGEDAARRGIEGGGHQGRGDRTSEAPVFDLYEDAIGARLRVDLRSVRAAHYHAHAQRLLSRPRRRARSIHAGG